MGIMPTLREHSYQMKRLRIVDRDGGEETHMDLAPLYEAQRGRFISLAHSHVRALAFGPEAQFERFLDC